MIVDRQSFGKYSHKKILKIDTKIYAFASSLMKYVPKVGDQYIVGPSVSKVGDRSPWWLH